MKITVITNCELGWDCVIGVVAGDVDAAVRWLNRVWGYEEDELQTYEQLRNQCIVFHTRFQLEEAPE